jgi:3-hydroxyacyl-CoA dehydrogenase
VKILEEKIAIKPSDIDVVYNNGYGFPRWRGGPMNYADKIGLDKILNNIKSYEKENSSFWSCPKLLEQLVSEGKKFKDLN